MKQRAEVTFEMEETVVLREGSKISVSYCAECRKEVLMATPQATAFLTGVSERQIFRLIETQVLHFSENGCVRVCLESANISEGN